MSDNVEHAIASLPVTVKLIEADDDVAAVRARVTVGALVSGNVVVVVVVVDVVVVVSLLPELLLGAAVVVVTAGGATVVVDKVVVVEVVVGKVEIVVVAGAANHFTGVFSHQHTPVRGHRNTPESLSAHARISLVEVGRASRVPLKGH